MIYRFKHMGNRFLDGCFCLSKLRKFIDFTGENTEDILDNTSKVWYNDLVTQTE